MASRGIQETRRREELAAFLQRHPIPCAYPLGYLDDDYADHCRWFVSKPGEEIEALVLVYSGLARPGLFTAGASSGVVSILQEVAALLPTDVTAHIPVDHVDAVTAVFEATTPLKPMHRMGLSRDDYGDRRHDLLSEQEVIRLTHIDTAAIMRLYAHWPDHFFEPHQLETGLYFGVRSEGRELACIAGTHNLSSAYDIAAIGNLVTHPDHRGRGHAKLCTARLLRELFQRVRHVTLDVQRDNDPAIRTYRHFGFRHYSDFHEGHLVHRQASAHAYRRFE